MDLCAVWGSSAADADSPVVYAAGERGTILIYDGSSWQQEASPTRRDLYGLWGSSAGDVYAVGRRGIMLHNNDGGGWGAVDVQARDDLNAVWGSSASDIHAVGANGTILDYDGESWSRMRSPVAHSLQSVWGSPDGVFAVGRNLSLLYYDGTVWQALDLMPSAADLQDVWGRSPDGGLFAVGRNGTFLQQAGRDWISLDSGTGGALYDVWCSSETDVFLVGQDGTFLYYDGAIRPAGFETGARLHGIWGSMVTTDIFAVGSGGVILHGRNE
jgi:photosystem II stability/assembly factor-like uncharacterized protein